MVKVFIDGSSNGYYGYLLEDGTKRIIKDYPMTNNQAEWLALLLLVVELPRESKAEVYSDSQILVNQFNGEFKTRNESLRSLKESCREIIELNKLKVSLFWVPREKNQLGKEIEKILRKERKEREALRKKVLRG